MTKKMCLVLILFFLPLVTSLATVQIHRNSVYRSNWSCSFIVNLSLSNNPSIDQCIRACINDNDCQTGIYFRDEHIYSIYAELCQTDSIQPSGNVSASVICSKKTPGIYVLKIFDK